MATTLYVPAVSAGDAVDQAARLESREQREELADLIAQKMIQAQRAAASADAAAAAAPITRVAFDRLSPQAKMDLMRAKRPIID